MLVSLLGFGLELSLGLQLGFSDSEGEGIGLVTRARIKYELKCWMRISSWWECFQLHVRIGVRVRFKITFRCG